MKGKATIEIEELDRLRKVDESVKKGLKCVLTTITPKVYYGDEGNEITSVAEFMTDSKVDKLILKHNSIQKQENAKIRSDFQLIHVQQRDEIYKHQSEIRILKNSIEELKTKVLLYKGLFAVLSVGVIVTSAIIILTK